MVFIAKMDEERASFQNALEDIKAKFRMAPVPVTIPMGEGADFNGVIDVINAKAYVKPASHDQKEVASEIPAEYKDAYEAARTQLFEAAAEGSDELMEKYLTEGELSQDEMLSGLKKRLRLPR